MRKDDERVHGSYRTKETILGYYDRMAVPAGPLAPPKAEARGGRSGDAAESALSRALCSSMA